jgi:GWxTD domain-containing protein
MLRTRGVRSRGLIVAAVVVLMVPGAYGQVEMTGRTELDVSGTVSLDAIAFAGTAPGQSRMDVFLQVGYDALTFVKQDNRYYASYEVTLGVFDSAQAQVTEKVWTEEVRIADFNQSIASTSFSLTQKIIPLSPGRYLIHASVRDNESRMVRKMTRQILVTDFNAPEFSLSDVMLLSRVSIQGEKRSIVPNVSSNVGDLIGKANFYLEVYNRSKIDSARLVISVLNRKGERVAESDTLVTLVAGKNERILQFDQSRLPLGDYRMFVRAFRASPWPSPDTAYLAVTNRTFIIRLRGMPKNMKDLDLAIDQLRYIAKESEFSALKDAKTEEEKQRLFLEFWKNRDPNPNTPRNERMEEYYLRVDYANKNFSHYIEGWRTDMGMVYIIFGPPNNVERHPFDPDSKPYEVWTYYDLNYYFVFEDRTGFGDFRLTTPLAEVWNRRPY